MRSWANEPLFPLVVLVSYLVAALGASWVLRRRELAVVGGGAGLALLVGAFGVGPVLPTTWMTSMREWHTVDRLRLVVGEGSQAGPLLAGFWLPLLTPTAVTYRDLVAVDLGAALAALVVTGWLAWRVGGLPGLVAPLAWALSPVGLVTALSETEAGLVALHLPPVVAAGWLAGGRVTPRARGGAVLVVVGLGLPLVLLRLELAAFVVGALLAAARPWLRGGEGRFTAWVDRTPPWGWALWALAWAWAAVTLPVPGLALVERAGELGQGVWLAVALDPLNTRWLALPALVAAVAPLGLVLAAAVGGAWALRRPARAGFVAPALLVVWGTWWLAAHGGARGMTSLVSPWEIVRYGALGMPVVVLLAARGLGALEGTARVVVMALMLAPPVPALIGALMPEHAGAHGAPDVSLAGLFAHDQAREVRYLVELAEADPRCALLTQGRPWGAGGADGLVWVAALPTGPGVRFREGGPGGLADGLALVEDAPCVDLVLSLDCQAQGVTACGWASQIVERQTWDHKPFLHRQHGATWAGQAAIGRVRVRDDGGAPTP